MPTYWNTAHRQVRHKPCMMYIVVEIASVPTYWNMAHGQVRHKPCMMYNVASRARGGGGAGGGGASAPHFFENYKELLRKKCLQPPHFESLVSPPLSKQLRGPWVEIASVPTYWNTAHGQVRQKPCMMHIVVEIASVPTYWNTAHWQVRHKPCMLYIVVEIASVPTYWNTAHGQVRQKPSGIL